MQTFKNLVNSYLWILVQCKIFDKKVDLSGIYAALILKSEVETELDYSESTDESEPPDDCCFSLDQFNKDEECKTLIEEVGFHDYSDDGSI